MKCRLPLYNHADLVTSFRLYFDVLTFSRHWQRQEFCAYKSCANCNTITKGRYTVHYPCSQDVFMGREKGRPTRVLFWTTVFAGPCSRPMNTAREHGWLKDACENTPVNTACPQGSCLRVPVNTTRQHGPSTRPVNVFTSTREHTVIVDGSCSRVYTCIFWPPVFTGRGRHGP